MMTYTAASVAVTAPHSTTRGVAGAPALLRPVASCRPARSARGACRMTASGPATSGRVTSGPATRRLTASNSTLHLTGPVDDSVDALLCALQRWAMLCSAPCSGGRAPAPLGRSVAHLEVGDGDISDRFPLTAAKVAELTALLAGDQRRNEGYSAEMRGITHAITAAAAAAAIATYRWHQAPALAATTAAIALGAGTEPDVDQPGSCIARAFGPITEALAWTVRRLSGGHREGTHTAAGNAISAGLAAIAIALESWHPHVHVHGVTVSVPVGRALLGTYLALLFAAGMGAVRWPRRTSRRWAVAVGASAAIAVTGWDAAGIAWAIFIGAAIHCAGDALTKDGDPWLDAVHFAQVPPAAVTAADHDRPRGRALPGLPRRLRRPGVDGLPHPHRPAPCQQVAMTLLTVPSPAPGAQKPPSARLGTTGVRHLAGAVASRRHSPMPGLSPAWARSSDVKGGPVRASPSGDRHEFTSPPQQPAARTSGSRPAAGPPASRTAPRPRRAARLAAAGRLPALAAVDQRLGRRPAGQLPAPAAPRD